MKIIGWTFIIGAIITLILGLFWASFFRDGLGPGMIVSTGYIAIMKTLRDAIPILIFSFVLMSVGLLFKNKKPE
jgi:hypothetical protein